MPAKERIKHFFAHFEEHVCEILLAIFVTLLFVQIILRQFFAYTIPWGEELATYMFVWFAYLGAVVAAKMSAHNRVSFQFRFFPPIVQKVSEAFADLLWVMFNLYFTWLSYDFVFNRMNLFWKSQTTGIPMKYFYMILPVAFLLMSIHILRVNYLKLFKKVDIIDPETEELQALTKTGKPDVAAKADTTGSSPMPETRDNPTKPTPLAKTAATVSLTSPAKRMAH